MLRLIHTQTLINFVLVKQAYIYSSNISMDSNSTNVARFLLADKKYYIRTVWGEDSFELSCSDGKYIWTGSASKGFVENTLKPKGMSTSEFMKITQNALTNQDFTKIKYSYTIEQPPVDLGLTPQDLLFSWFIKLGAQNGNNFALNSTANKKVLQVKCTLPLVKQINPRPMMVTILDWLIDKSSRLELSNQELSENNNQLQSQRDQALAQFSTLVADKKVLELEMYKKFVLVLNEKKKKIRELKEEVKNAPTVSVTQHQEMASSEDESESNHSPPRSRSPSPPPAQKSHTTLGSIDKLTPSIDLLEPVAPIFIPVRKRHRLNEDTQADTNGNGSSSNNNNNNNNSKTKKSNGTIASKPKPTDKNGASSSSNNNNNNNHSKTSLKPPQVSSPKVSQKSPHKSSNLSSPKAKKYKSLDEDDDPDDLLDLI
eukprot:TRINITY_DN1602_c0_g2_i1.p1 TRINITY_DN1602_c0_g2~~TRINITY_DN1602_c0_g2_i1.p1  ORF type:complete len:428 (-),score=104.27 TRINITY_DN1602_c0_g2_i1:90-1373(-)